MSIIDGWNVKVVSFRSTTELFLLLLTRPLRTFLQFPTSFFFFFDEQSLLQIDVFEKTDGGGEQTGCSWTGGRDAHVHDRH